MTTKTAGWMKGRRLIRAAVTLACCVALAPAAAASAQSLGDLARQGEAQRNSASPGRTYTNENLGAVEAPATPATAAEATPEAQTPPTPAVEAPKPGMKLEEDQATGHTNMKAPAAREKRDEQYWRSMIAGVRTTIARLNGDIAAQQAKLDQVDGSSPTAAREREVVSATIARLQKDLSLQNNELFRWTARARAANVSEDAIK